MAFNGTISVKACRNVLEYSIEWTTALNVVDNTFTISGKFYLDNSNEYGLLPIYSKNSSETSYIRIADQTIKFAAPRISGKGKHLIYEFTSNPIKAEEEQPKQVYIGAKHDFNKWVGSDALNSALYENGVAFGGNFTIDAINRTSKIDSISGSKILGIANDCFIAKANEDFTHTIEYICGSKSGVLCTLESSPLVSITLPVDLATERTDKATLDVTFKITTYLGTNMLKSATRTETYEMPDSVAPSCTVAVSDAEALTDTYGGYIQRWSRLFIEVTPTLSFGSPIVKYEISANGAVYDIDKNTVTTAVLKNSGKQTISVIVTDGRGRTGTDEIEIDVMPWAKPQIDLKTPFRTDADGNYQSDGEYITISFDASVSPLNGKNSAEYEFQWRKVSGLAPGKDILEHYADMLTVTDGKFTFKADNGAAYEITLYVTDDFDTDHRTRGGSNAVVLMHFGSDGESMAVGGYATLKGVLDVFFKLYPRGGFIHPKLTSINETTPNTYYCENPQDLGLPSRLAAVVKDPFVMEVVPISDDGNVMHRITTCPSDVNEVPLILVRSLQGANWNPWFNVVSGEDYA